MDDSDSSSLSSAPPTDDEKLAPIFLKARSKAQIKKPKAKPKPPAEPVSPPRPKRSPSPPHEEVLADDFNIAFIVMFRSRFSAAFPPKLPNFGPQDIERGVVDPTPSIQIENLLCALIGIVLNRKKPVERGHHNRALEDVMSTMRPQWPRSWNSVNPLAGGRSFTTMTPADRLDFLRTLIIWSLSSSELIQQTIKDSYKQSRNEDDRNQPLSVQPWGADSDKRRYWLIEGQDDTSFRLYREGNRSLKNIPWRSMAGTIDEIKEMATKLEKDDSQSARRLSTSISAAIPRFEATEEKRKRREYRQVRRAQFSRPEPGFSLYEGRTRGKRMRYTFDDDADDSDELSVRRSTRNSDRSTPAEGPTVTASGRTVRPRGGGLYGESLLSGQANDTGADDLDGSEGSEGPRATNRGTRSSGRLGQLDGARKRKLIEGYNDVDEMSDEDDAASSGGWNSADNDDEEEVIKVGVAKDEASGEESEPSDEEMEQDSLVVKLRVPRLSEVRSSGMYEDDRKETHPQPDHALGHMNGLPGLQSIGNGTPSAFAVTKPPTSDSPPVVQYSHAHPPKPALPAALEHPSLQAWPVKTEQYVPPAPSGQANGWA